MINETRNQKKRVMAEKRSRKIFVNLAVRELKKSMEFFRKLGHHWEVLWMDPQTAQQ